MAVESPIASDLSLEQLPDVERTFYFTDPQKLRQDIWNFFDDGLDSLRDYTVLIKKFPLESLDTDDEEHVIPANCKILYLENRQCLFLTLTSSPHETASQTFGDIMREKLLAMHCDEECISTERANRKLTNLQKTPDLSWRPEAGLHITLALEVEVSESERGLALDAKIWLEDPESHVAQVITIRINRTRPEIVFSVWEATKEETDTDTRVKPLPKSKEVQKGIVTLEQERLVANGRITLSFSNMFERQARRGTAERDVIFSALDLERVSRVVWQEMGFRSQ
jgi:hypothetical protein